MSAPTPLHIDPLLGEISELLHRMAESKTAEPQRWMAADALRKLQQYEDNQRQHIAGRQ